MKVSAKVECGIVALLDIAINCTDGSVVKVVNIARRQGVSAKYLEQILPILRNASLIRSVKGARGGYTLAKEPEKITLCQVIEALDISLLNDSSFDENLDPLIAGAISDKLWSRMNANLRQCAESVTIADLVSCYQEQSQFNTEALFYYI
ncbi:MAG: Rrf2 family transcriptional regulator [Ruminococcus sp.]|jgi:Rrf2 family protein|nr:Rrf2 family transcriptional regulator [Ruminococcus sp.]